MPYTYAHAQCLRLRLYFEVLHRGLRGPLDPVNVRALIVQHRDRALPRNPNGLFTDCPPPAPTEAADALYEIVLLNSPCFPTIPPTELRVITLADHCAAYQMAV